MPTKKDTDKDRRDRLAQDRFPELMDTNTEIGGIFTLTNQQL